MNLIKFFNNIDFLLEKRDKIKLYLIFLGMIFASILELIGIGSIPVFSMVILDVQILVKNSHGFITNDFIDNIGKKNFILISSIFIILVFLIKNIFLGLLHYSKSKFILSLKIKLTSRLFDGYLYAPYLFHVSRNSSVLIRNLNDVIFNSLRSIESFLNLLLELLVFIVLIFFLLKVDFNTSISIFISLGTFSVLFYLSVKKKLKKWGAEIQTLHAKELQTLNQNLGSIKEIKILRRENYQSSNFKKIVSKIGSMSFYHGIMQSIPRLALEIIAIIFIVSICFFYLQKGMIFEEIIPLISLFGVAAIRMIPSLNVINLSLNSIKFQSPAIKTLIQELKIIDNFIKNKIQKNSENIKEKYLLNKKSLFLKDINFSYDSKKILNNISMQINFGQTIGIIGPSGSGKTTLLNIILGLIEPKKGDIKIDGLNLNNHLDEWRQTIGYVPQDTYLLDASIKNNIAFGVDDNEVCEKKLEKAINFSQNKEFIESLPKKIETFVGDRGVRISGGQKQRIGIARALYNDPNVLVLDEATSNLDIENENKIIEEISNNKKSMTVIIISHRKNTVKNCDNIFLMKEGKIKELGSFEKIKNIYEDFFSKDN
jgi:ATP-binding cassette, subfamily B, bacterial PglK